MISSAANVRLYPVMTHCSCESVVSKSVVALQVEMRAVPVLAIT